jgi:hypothetical protein
MTELEAEEFFFGTIPWKPADDSPTTPFKNTIIMTELPQAKSSILGDEDQYEETPQSINGMLAFLTRWPHLLFDSLGAFPNIKGLSDDETVSKISRLSSQFIESWKLKDNIQEALVEPPESGGKKASFVAIGINQLLAAGLMYRGKENKPNSYTLWIYRFSEMKWKETSFTFPSHQGVALENGGFHLLILCKGTVRCIDCYSQENPVQRWQSEPIVFTNPKQALEYQCGLVSAFGTVFLETSDNKVYVFTLHNGTLIQTIIPDINVISIGCSQQTFVLGSDRSEVAIYGRERKQTDQFHQLNLMKYAGDLKTKSGKTLKVPVAPVLQIINHTSKLCFVMGRKVVMEERHPSMQRMRILESLPTAALGLIADHVVTMGPDGILRLAYFAESKAFFEKKYDIGPGTWRHNQNYISGTFATVNIIFPSGKLLILRPKTLVKIPEIKQ